MSHGPHWKDETVAPPASKIPLLSGAAAGLVLAVGLAVFLWPASEGRVVFELEPSDAEVVVLHQDGERVLPRSATAVTAVLEAGSHRAEITADGFEPAVVDFEIVGGELHTVSVILAASAGAVEFAIEPTDALLEITPAAGGDARALPLVDGHWQGELEVGDYIAHVSASGHQEETVVFAVTAAEPTLLPISLRSIARHTRDTVVVPAPGWRGPGYRGPGYYGPRYYGPGYRRPPRPRVP